MTARRLSSEKRHLQRYRHALDYLEGLSSDDTGDALYAIDTYVAWLNGQLTNKRLTIQALNAELDELR